MPYGEGPPNWLSEIIKDAREIDKRRPRLERRAEIDAILVAIRRHPAGAAFCDDPSLSPTINEALDIADQAEEHQDKHPDLMTASPEVQASWRILRKFAPQEYTLLSEPGNPPTNKPDLGISPGGERPTAR